MTSTTATAIRAIARADSTIDERQLRAALDALSGKSALPALQGEPLDAILTRDDVAKLLHRTVKQVDVLCRRGALIRHYPRFADGKRVRSDGILASSFRAYVATGNGGTGAGAASDAATESEVA